MTVVEIQRGPRRATQWLLVLFLTGVCSRGTGFYGQTLKISPEVWMEVIHGTANAPEQYRIGIVKPAYWITQHLALGGHKLQLNEVFGAFDLLGSIVGVLLLYGLLERTQVYRRATPALQWFGSAGFLALVLYAVDWTEWYQKVGTLPSVGLLALMAWLWSPNLESKGDDAGFSRTVWTAAGLLTLVAVQSFVRADLALTVCLGVFITTALGISARLSISRGAALVTSALGVLLSVGIQLYLSKVVYPQATYGPVKVFMLRYDYWELKLWASCLIFIAPVLWTTVQALRYRGWGEGPGRALLLAALIHAALWITMGRLDEVRIFLPMALVTLPLTMEIAMRRVEQDSVKTASQE
jgi:hypothetical protein